jgi:nicotinate-nucleotide adenylyltransferase
MPPALPDILPSVRRGIFGGTFDPIHIAHLSAAEVAYHALHLDVVTFLPAGAPWQKSDREVAAAEHRLAMTELAVAGVDYFEVDDREVRRPGPTYTIDTLDEMADDDITLILGADSAAGLGSWHRSRDVLDRVDVAVVPRPGTRVEEVTVVADRLTWISMPDLDISGVRLRSMVASGLSIRFLVPEPVWRYIGEHRLYV